MTRTMIVGLTYLVMMISFGMCDGRSLWGNTPEYEAHWSYLMNISSSQKFILNYLRLPKGINFNPAMGLWPLNSSGNAISTLNPQVFVMSAQGYACGGCPTTSYIASLDGFKVKSYQLGPKSVLGRRENGEFYPMLLGDPRVFRYDGKTFVMCVGSKYGVQQPFLTELNYDETQKALYVQEPFLYISTEHEFGHVAQKNWSPFEYYFRGRRRTNASASKTFFVFSVNPHRIVDANETFISSRNENELKAHTICHTEIIEPSESYWKWGPIHGGSNSLLVDTPWGPRYLAFFHSQSKFMVSWMTTYFMGAYLFEAEPPFAVTHISDAPIIPRDLYDEKIDGWAFKAMDYIIFPMNILQYEDKIILSLGRNDRSGYLVQFNATELVKSLQPVHSAVIKDVFYEHAFISNY